MTRQDRRKFLRGLASGGLFGLPIVAELAAIGCSSPADPNWRQRHLPTGGREGLHAQAERLFDARIYGRFSEVDLRRLIGAYTYWEGALDHFDQLAVARRIDYRPSDTGYRLDEGGRKVAGGMVLGTLRLYGAHPGILLHEYGHLWHQRLPEKEEFDQDWLEIVASGPVDARPCRDFTGWEGECRGNGVGRRLPKNGFFTPYASAGFLPGFETNELRQAHDEDVAEAIFRIGEHLHAIRHGASVAELAEEEYMTDDRYARKEGLLARHGLFSVREQHLLRPLYRPS